MHGTHKHYLQINHNLNRNPEDMQNLGPGKFSRNRNKNARYHPNVKKGSIFALKVDREVERRGDLNTGHCTLAMWHVGHCSPTELSGTPEKNLKGC